jgi:hypothetical protein
MDMANGLIKKGFNIKSKDLPGILRLISGPGYKSATRNYLKKASESAALTNEVLKKLADASLKDAEQSKEKTGGKGHREWAAGLLTDVENNCGFPYISKENGKARHWNYSVMLDHAARKVSVTHSWIKLAEAKRRKFDTDSEKIIEVPEEAKKWLDDFCLRRTEEFGSSEEYRIRPRAVSGWKQVVEAWAKPECADEQDRIEASRKLQDDPEIEKFGDNQLFEAISADEAKCIWLINGKPDPRPLLNYVATRNTKNVISKFPHTDIPTRFYILSFAISASRVGI